jgi:hypothetical protein
MLLLEQRVEQVGQAAVVVEQTALEAQEIHLRNLPHKGTMVVMVALDLLMLQVEAVVALVQ